VNTPAQTTRTLLIERVLPHAPEKVWRALTENTLLAQWLMKNDFEPVTGRKFQFKADPVPGWNGIIDAEVLVVEPLKQLSYTWSSMGSDFVVLWTLSPTEAGTQLRLEQSGFGPDQNAAYQGANYGWQRFLGNLDRVLTEVA
jgi:uncharacterized protein YndB with AHSA1/START domain